MNRKAARYLLLIAAAGSLAACGSKDPDANASANVAAANEAVAEPDAANEVTATPAAAPAVAGAPTADFMVGKWSAMGEDCKDVLEFKNDGTVATPIGPGKWALDGDKLSFDYGDGSKQEPSTIKVLSADRIEITRASGGKETEKRCP